MKTIAEIKAEFAAADMSSYPALYEIYKKIQEVVCKS